MSSDGPRSRMSEILRKAQKKAFAAAAEGSKGMEKYTIPEILTDNDWLHITGQAKSPIKLPFAPVKPKQILLIDIYSSWSGPCAAMEGHLRRMRHQFVTTPDCLALARACSDNIQELKAFKSDPRPTFLFWTARGPVALLRGANRPLLTRLVEQEVAVEIGGGPEGGGGGNSPPPPPPTIDFESERVIQCRGELALLDEDEVVHSIGIGSTDMLTSFFQEPPPTSKKKAAPAADEQQENKENASDNQAQNDTSEKDSHGEREKPSEEVVPKEGEGDEGQVEDNANKEGDVEEQGDQNPGSRRSSVIKLETGLLKEILDAKPKKRYGI